MKLIKKISIVDSIVEQLLEAIRSGQLKSGEKIPSERQLTVTLGVSRTALREAIKRLESLGVLTVRQGDGTYLNDRAEQQEKMIRQEIQNLFSLGDVGINDFVDGRILIESRAAALATERATDEELLALESLKNQMESNITSPETYVRLDLEFHRSLIKMAHNPVLLRFAWAIEDLMSEQVRRSVLTQETLAASQKAHVEVVEALKSRNPKSAEKSIANHLQKIPTRFISAALNRSPSATNQKPTADVLHESRPGEA